jgi:hypothetical protein
MGNHLHISAIVAEPNRHRRLALRMPLFPARFAAGPYYSSNRQLTAVPERPTVLLNNGGVAMKHTQAELDFAFLHINQLETTISAQRGKITRMREQELSTGGDEEGTRRALACIRHLEDPFRDHEARQIQAASS